MDFLLFMELWIGADWKTACIHQNAFIGRWQNLIQKIKERKKDYFIEPDYQKVPVAKKEFRRDRMQTFGKYHQESVILSWLCFLFKSFILKHAFSMGWTTWLLVVWGWHHRIARFTNKNIEGSVRLESQTASTYFSISISHAIFEIRVHVYAVTSVLSNSSGDLPDPGIRPRFSCIAGRFFTVWTTREDIYILKLVKNTENCNQSSL